MLEVQYKNRANIYPIYKALSNYINMTTYSHASGPTHVAGVNAKYYVWARKLKQSNGTNDIAFTKSKPKAAY